MRFQWDERTQSDEEPRWVIQSPAGEPRFPSGLGARAVLVFTYVSFRLLSLGLQLWIIFVIEYFSVASVVKHVIR